jgi:hypothetical protein
MRFICVRQNFWVHKKAPHWVRATLTSSSYPRCYASWPLYCIYLVFLSKLLVNAVNVGDVLYVSFPFSV